MALVSPSESKNRAEAALATSPHMKFAYNHPSFETSNLSPLQNTASSASQPGASQAPGLVPIAWFLTTSPAYSSNSTAGLLRPAPEHGVHLVSCVPAPSSAETADGNKVAVLKMCGFIPLYEFPESAALCVSAAFAFLTFSLEQQPTSLLPTHRNALPIIHVPTPSPVPKRFCADSFTNPKVDECLSEVVLPGQ